MVERGILLNNTHPINWNWGYTPPVTNVKRIMKTITFNHPITKKKLFELPVESICSQSTTITIFGEVGHQYLTKELAILGHSLGIIKSWELYDDGFRVRIPNELIRYEG